MFKKIILLLIGTALLFLGAKPFIKSPYFALLLGDVQLYYELKSTPLAVEKCLPYLESETAMDICVSALAPKIAAQLRNGDQ